MFQEEQHEPMSIEKKNPNKVETYSESLRKENRQSRINDLRKLSNSQVLNWQKIKSTQFFEIVETCNNVFTLLLTMFEIA